jgi:hypothetical protein
MEQSEMRTGVGGPNLAHGVSYKAPHPGLRFASAFPPHRFAGGGIRGSAFKCDSPALAGKGEMPRVRIPAARAQDKDYRTSYNR